MVIRRTTPTQKFDIWSPRWKDMWVDGKKAKSPVVLLAKQRIGLHNEVEFTRTKSLRFKGNWYISGEEAQKYPTGTNGAIECYEIPFNVFQPLQRIDDDMIEDLKKLKKIFGGN